MQLIRMLSALRVKINRNAGTSQHVLSGVILSAVSLIYIYSIRCARRSIRGPLHVHAEQINMTKRKHLTLILLRFLFGFSPT